MRINPVLRNEATVGVRTWKFPLMVSIYSVVLAGIGCFLLYGVIKESEIFGLDLNISIQIYLILSVVQALLLMFMVPSMSAPAITSEREKQTLDVLLSTKMSSLSIIIGKLFASVSKVIILIVVSLPIYGIVFQIGGVDLNNLFQLSLFFIVNAFFIGAIGIFYSTYLKSTKAATAATYATVLVMFIVIFVAAFVVYVSKASGLAEGQTLNYPVFAHLSPVTGLMSLLVNQLGASNIMAGPLMIIAPMLTLQGFDNSFNITMIVEVIATLILVYISSVKLNPLNSKGLKVRLANLRKKK